MARKPKREPQPPAPVTLASVKAPKRKRVPGQRLVTDQFGRLYPFPIRLDETLRAELSALAKADRRALGVYIVIALEDHVRRKRMEGWTPPQQS